MVEEIGVKGRCLRLVALRWVKLESELERIVLIKQGTWDGNIVGEGVKLNCK